MMKMMLRMMIQDEGEINCFFLLKIENWGKEEEEKQKFFTHLIL